MIFAILIPASLLAQLAYGLCPPGTLTGLTPTDCYTFNDAAGWMEAQSTCKQQGGNLASVHSAFENSFVFDVMGWLTSYKNSGSSVYLGASKNIFSEDWTWIDGMTFTYTASSPSASNVTYPSCVTMNPADPDGPKWGASTCVAQLPFICKVPALNNAKGCSKARIQGADAATCYGVASVYNQDTYRDEGGSWTDIQGACMKEGGSLAAIKDGPTNDAITKLMSWWGGSFWLGGTRNIRFPDWRWLDGSAFFFANWESGKEWIEAVTSVPSSIGYPTNTADPCMYVSDQGQWLNTNCETSNLGLCEKPASK